MDEQTDLFRYLGNLSELSSISDSSFVHPKVNSQAKKLCKCGCGNEIIIIPYHKYYGIPDFIHHHYHHQNNEKSRKKQSETMKQLYKNGKIKIWNKGLTVKTDERVKKYTKKMGETMKRLYNEGKLKPTKTTFKKGHRPTHGFKKGLIPWNKNLTKETDERVKRYSQKVKQKRAKQISPLKDTKIEVKIQNYLKRLGYEFFTHQYMKEIEHGYQCDILIPALDLVIECDGDYWHKYPIGNDLDHIRTKELIEKGFKVLRLWEREIKIMGLEEFKIKISKIGERNCNIPMVYFNKKEIGVSYSGRCGKW